MESLEVWMWVIAGLLIGIILFIAGSSLLGRYLHSQDIGLSRSNFGQLADTVKKICRLGVYSEETVRLRFPSSADKIAVVDADKIEGEGKQLCLWIRGQEGVQCIDTDLCVTKMNTVVFEDDVTTQSLLQRITKGTEPSVFTFSVAKSSFDTVAISWKPN